MIIARLRGVVLKQGRSPCRCNSTYKANKEDKQRHEYQNQNPWKSVKQFSDSLTKNIIYNEDGLVILNKPYGIGLLPPQINLPKHCLNAAKTTHLVYTGQCQYSLTEALPNIAENLGYDKLTVLKIPERYTSGITVLSSNEKVTNKYKTCMKKARGRQELCAHYWAVVIGNPALSSAVQKLGLMLKVNPIANNDKQPMVVQQWSKNAVKRGDVKVFSVKHHTLNTQNLASLVEIAPSATKWHFLRVYLAHLLSPVLGDNLYGSRVQHVQGVPLAINPCSDAAKGPKKLQQNLMATLSLQPGQEVTIPTHLHLQRLNLSHMEKDRDLIIEAPLPSSFQWTCESLGLLQPNHEENLSCTVNCNR